MICSYPITLQSNFKNNDLDVSHQLTLRDFQDVALNKNAEKHMLHNLISVKQTKSPMCVLIYTEIYVRICTRLLILF